MDTSIPKLDRALRLPSTFFLVTGGVIGSGVFLVASDIATSVSGPFWGLSAWLVAGVISFVGGLIFAELGTRFPKAGGQYVYLKKACQTFKPCVRTKNSKPDAPVEFLSPPELLMCISKTCCRAFRLP